MLETLGIKSEDHQAEDMQSQREKTAYVDLMFI